MQAELDETKLAAFEERMVGVWNAGALCLMLSIGHRTGLFDAMAAMPPATSARIAAAAGLDERYVREWLSATTCAGMIELDPAAGTYGLPAEHAARLSRAVAPDEPCSAGPVHSLSRLGRRRDRRLLS